MLSSSRYVLITIRGFGEGIERREKEERRSGLRGEKGKGK
jgi:hypothetical protein